MRAPLLAIALALSGCGYRSAHALADPLGPFAITTSAARIPHASVIAAVEEGARAELSRAGALDTSGAAGLIEIEVLRLDEVSAGIALGAAGTPLSRGSRLVVTGRARVRRAGSAAVLRDTGDVRASDTAARADGPLRGVVVSDEAARQAGRRLGEILVQRLLGFPEPGEP